MNRTRSYKSHCKRKIWLLLLILGITGGLFFIYDSVQFSKKVNALTPQHKQVQIIGHAGRAFFSPINPFNPLPPNSYSSLLKALTEDGAQGLEVDVHVSRDGVPVLYHDETLNSMSEGSGRIEDLPAKAVLGLAYKGGWPYDLFHKEKIISLETLFRELQNYPEYPLLHLDLRSFNPERHLFFASRVIALWRKYHYPLDKISVIYSQPELLLAFRELEPKTKLLLDMDESFETTLKTILANQLHGIVADGRHLDAAQIKQIRNHRLQIYLFGGKSRNTIYKMILLQPDAIEVNNVRAMREMFE